MIETLVHPRKIKTKTPTCPLYVLTACGQWPRLDYPLIYMAQNNLNSLRSLWFSLSGIEQKIQLKNIYILPIFTVVSPIHPFSNFSYFFQFLPFQVEEPISSSKPSQFPGSNEHVNSNETVKYWYSAQLCCCFISLENYNFLQEKILPTRYSYIFKLFFNLYPSFFHFKWKKAISSRKPSQFLVSLPLEGTAIKYLYSAHFWLLFH